MKYIKKNRTRNFTLTCTEACPIGVYFNFARHTREPYRKIGSPIGHVWWLTNDQAISYASRTGKI